MSLLDQKILLTGLPGAGKSRVAGSLQQQYGCDVLDYQTWQPADSGLYEWNDVGQLPNPVDDIQQWCVIDARSTLQDEPEWIALSLKKILATADAVVFSFIENTALDQQSWWNRWLADSFAELGREPAPVVRWFHQQFATGFKGFENLNLPTVEANVVPLGKSVEFEFQVGQVVLDHLLMGLDNSRRNLGMKITRVEAVLQTFEFDNLVALQGTAYRFDRFAAEQNAQAGIIKISGFDLDQSWFNQLIQASSI